MEKEMPVKLTILKSQKCLRDKAHVAVVFPPSLFTHSIHEKRALTIATST